MTTTKPPPQDEPDAKPSASRRESLIRAGVLKILGRPVKLFKVAVVPLWEDNYRVNVVTGDDVTAVQIPYSYFVTADDDGNILGSTPPLRKLY